MTRPPAFLPNWPARIAWIALAIYTLYAASILNITWERFVTGLHNGVKFIGRMLPPDTAADKMALLARGLYETFAFITRRNAHLSPATRAFIQVAEKRVAALRRRLDAEREAG